MDLSSLIFFTFFAVIAGSFLFKRAKYGSWTGAFLGASIKREVGEVTLDKFQMTTRTIRFAVMGDARSDNDCVGLTLISKAALGASMVPYKLTRQQALDLAMLLQQAAR